MRKSKKGDMSNGNDIENDHVSGGEDAAEKEPVLTDEASVNEEPSEPEDKIKDPPKKRKSKSKSKSKDKPKKDEDAEEEYEVEKILDSKTVRGQTHFLIRWKGYQPESDTWEPEDTVACPDLIAEFKASQSNGKQKRKSKSAVKAGGKKKKIEKKRRTTSPKKSYAYDDDDDDVDENEEYEVDKIIEVHHKKNGKREFLIRWKGWSSSSDTWEPEEHLSCPDLIKKFMEKVKTMKSSGQRDLRMAPSTTKRFTLSTQSGNRRLSKRAGNKQRVRYDDAE